MEAHFILLPHKGNPKQFSLKKGESIVIGRSEKLCNIAVEDDLCSSQHCKISFNYNQITIKDLDSKNGIFVNGSKVLLKNISLKDKVSIGKSSFFLNPKLMKNAIITSTNSTDSQHSHHQQNTLQIQQHDNLTRTMMAQKNHEKDLKRASLKPPPKLFIAVANYCAQALDFSVSVICFFLITTIVIRYNPHLYDLSHQYHFLTFLFQEQMITYSIICLACTFLFFKINKRLPGGSIGQRAFKHWK